MCRCFHCVFSRSQRLNVLNSYDAFSALKTTLVVLLYRLHVHRLTILRLLRTSCPLLEWLKLRVGNLFLEFFDFKLAQFELLIFLSQLYVEHLRLLAHLVKLFLQLVKVWFLLLWLLSFLLLKVSDFLLEAELRIFILLLLTLNLLLASSGAESSVFLLLDRLLYFLLLIFKL